MYCSLVFNTLTIVIFFIYGCNIDGWTAAIEKKKYVEQTYIFVSKKTMEIHRSCSSRYLSVPCFCLFIFILFIYWFFVYWFETLHLCEEPIVFSRVTSTTSHLTNRLWLLHKSSNEWIREHFLNTSIIATLPFCPKKI